MPVINRLPIGGGASSEPGISDGKGIVNLNIFTQTTEPTIKDGIWIKTSNKYQKVMINQKYANYESGAWSSASTLPYEFCNGSAVVYNGEIHILGSGINGNSTNHYKWNGSTWTRVSTLPYESNGGSAVVYNGEIHILGSGIYNNHTKHYKWNGSTWINVSTLPYESNDGSAVVYNGDMHILGGGSSNNYGTKYYKFQSPEKVYDPNTVIINRGSNTNNGTYLTAMADMSAIKGDGANNRFLSGFDDVFYFANTAFDWSAPMYYGDGTKWIKFKN